MNCPLVDYLYAGALMAGGVAGYASKGSVPSIVAGLLCGGVTGYGAYTNNNHLIAGTSGLLTGVMGYRAYKANKFMPAGLVAVISLAEFANKAALMMKHVNK